MRRWENGSSSNGKSNGKANGITTRSLKQDLNSWDYSQTQQEQTDNGQTVSSSPSRNQHYNANKDDKVTCSFQVILRKDGDGQPPLTKLIQFETFNLGNLSAEEMKRLEFKKMSFDLKVEESFGLGRRQLFEGTGEDENANACKPKPSSITGLHFDWSRFTLPRRSSVKGIPSKSAQLLKSLLIFLVLLLVVVGLVLSLDGASFFYSFMENICIEYQK